MMHEWTDIILSRGRCMESLGSKYLHLFAPDKISVYPEYYGEDLPCYNLRPNKVITDALKNFGAERFMMDAETVLKAAKPRVQSYWKTDTHWRAEGTYAVYDAVCRSLGLAPTFALTDKPMRERTAVFDLGGKLTPKVEESGPSYRVIQHAERVHANDLVLEGEGKGGAFPSGLLSGSYIVFNNSHPSAHDAKLVLFGDSYSEVRPTAGLTRMLAESFRETHFFWSSTVDMRQVERIRPDFVVSELAERFVRTLPDDSRDLVAYAEERLQKYRQGR